MDENALDENSLDEKALDENWDIYTLNPPILIANLEDFILLPAFQSRHGTCYQRPGILDNNKTGILLYHDLESTWNFYTIRWADAYRHHGDRLRVSLKPFNTILLRGGRGL